MIVKLKICGMKHNISEVASLNPDYLGFIFYGESPRDFDGKIPVIPSEIKKAGVFVDAEVDFISEKIKTYGLDIIQLHGNESPEFCSRVKGVNIVEIPVSSGVEKPVSSEVEIPVSSEVEIWKVFSIKDKFEFDRLIPYEAVVDKFLFDTKGSQKGGTGLTFDWEVLHDYKSEIPIILSGGIGLEELDAVRAILRSHLPIEIIDVNSRFETMPGKKDVSKLERFIEELTN